MPSNHAPTVGTGQRAARLVRRWPTWAALAFAVLFLAAQLVAPAPPLVTDSGSAVLHYYRSHAADVRLSTWLLVLGGVPYAVFVCWLRSVVPGLGADIAFFGGTTLGVASLIWAWFGAGLALHADTLQPATARVLADVAAYYGPVVTGSALLLAGPVVLAARHPDSGFPRWVGILSVTFVIEQVLETATLFPTHGFAAPGGAANFLIGAPLFLVWVIATATGYRQGTGQDLATRL